VSSVAYGNGKFVAIGGTNVVASTDGMFWSPLISATATNLSIVTYGKGLFVGAGLRGVIQTSTNGDVWTPRTSGTTRALLGAAFGNGRFVIVGNAGIVLVSDDGITWTNVASSSPFTTVLNGVTYGSGTFVAVGYPSPSTGFSTILTSPDGIAWTERTANSVQTLRGVAYGDGTFLAVGEQGTILQSAHPLEPVLTASGLGPGGFELTIVGEIGNVYALQSSTNLNSVGWIELVTFTNTLPSVSLVDTTAMSFPQRFYRIVSP
jgi:hypothetical protein